MITTANSYDGTLKQAGGSDETVRAKWAEWQKRIEILAGGEVRHHLLYLRPLADLYQDDINDHVPTTSLTHMTLPPSVRPLRASLEQLDDLIAHRATLVSEAKQINKNDDIRPKVLQEATKLAHGGSGDVKTEWFEGLFEESLRKYDEVKGDMDREVERQEGLLGQIRVSHASRAIEATSADSGVGSEYGVPGRTQGRSQGPREGTLVAGDGPGVLEMERIDR